MLGEDGKTQLAMTQTLRDVLVLPCPKRLCIHQQLRGHKEVLPCEQMHVLDPIRNQGALGIGPSLAV